VPAEGTPDAMMPPKRGVLSRPTKGQRRQARQQLGRLSKNVVTAGTRKRYDNALAWLFATLATLLWTVPASTVEFDELLCRIVDMAWNEGESRSLIGDVLSALGDAIPALRGRLPGAWRLVSAWSRLELPARAAPLSQKEVDALSYIAWVWGYFDVAVLLQLAFHAFLRTAELMSARVSQVCFSTKDAEAYLALPETKNSARKGTPEGVRITQSLLAKLLAIAVQGLLPGDTILRRTQTQFRTIFAQLVAEAKLDKGYKPYSLRRGGATAWFRASASLDATAERGRWNNLRTARIYVNTSLADFCEITHSADTEARISELAGAWHVAAERTTRGVRVERLAR